jgi:hypothetical protein
MCTFRSAEVTAFCQKLNKWSLKMFLKTEFYEIAFHRQLISSFFKTKMFRNDVEIKFRLLVFFS